MGERPAGATLERVNNLKGYSPENCRWATRLEQGRNTKKVVYITINNEKIPLWDACAKYNVRYNSVTARVYRNNQTHSEAIMALVEYKKTKHYQTNKKRFG